MSLSLHITRPDPLYYAWKKAVNTIGKPYWKSGCSRDERHQMLSAIYKTVENDVGCRVIKVHRKKDTDWLTAVDVEFLSEKHLTMFMLKWS